MTTQNKQLTKFENTVKKTTALQAIEKENKEKKQKEAYRLANHYNMTGTDTLFEGHPTNIALNHIDMYGEVGTKDLLAKGILEEECAAVFSHTGFQTWMKTGTIDRQRVAQQTAEIVMGEMLEHVINPMREQMNAMERKINLLLALVEAPSHVNNRPTRFEVEEIEEPVSQPVVLSKPIYVSVDTIVEPTKKELNKAIEKAQGASGKRRGARPAVYKIALETLSNAKRGKKGRLYKASMDIVAAMITKYSFENPEKGLKVGNIQGTELWAVYLYCQRQAELKGRWSEFVAKHSIKTKEAK